MTLLQSGLAKSLAEDYTIDNSLRFNDADSAYLSRTATSTGNRRTWTLSFWMKRGELTGDQTIIAWNGDDGGNHVCFSVQDSDGDWPTPVPSTLRAHIAIGDASVISCVTDNKLRDPSAWYHIVWSQDSTPASSGDRAPKIWVNGELVTDYASSDNTIAQNAETRANLSGDPCEVGGGSNLIHNDDFFDGYLAEYYWIDGTVYAPSDFGELDSTTNQWIPKDASDLTFGTNGFYQKYGATELANSFTDSSDSTNFTPTEAISVDYLVVAGGGGGNGNGAGGGGAALCRSVLGRV